MDRLETKRQCGQRIYRFNIYIPVWIDQKQGYLWQDNEYEQIYIPVWIDQKRLLLQKAI